MTYTSAQIDLVMNKLKRSQYEALKLSSLVQADQFYYITDDTPTETLISSVISSYYKIGSQRFTDDVSSMISSDATYVYQNEVKSNLDIYKVSRAQYEALKAAGEIKPDAYYYIVDDETTEQKISASLSNYYPKTETSSAAEISYALQNIDISGSLSGCYKKSETSSKTEIANQFTAYDEKLQLSVGNLCSIVSDVSASLDAQDTVLAQEIALVRDDISYLSDAISAIGSDYLDSNDKADILNQTLSPDEVKLYKGPGDKDISLSVGTGTQLCVYTATLSDFYLSSETSSAQQIQAALDSKIKLGTYKDQVYDLSSGNLSVVKIDADDYYELISEGKQDDSVLYIVSSDNINAHGERILKVGEPTLSDDAATKNYVDDKISSIDMSEYWKKTETSSASQISSEFKKYQLSGNYLLSSDLSFNYDSGTKYIYLKAFGNDIGTVNCADFIKDGMLSTVALCGNTLVFKFNTDAGITPISVNLSSFVDNYDAKITYLSNAISTDVKNLADNYWKKSETSSATELKLAFDGTTKAYVGWNGKGLSNVNSLSLINITRDDYYELADSGGFISGAQYIISNDTYLNWPSRISIDFLSSGSQSQDSIVSCINSIISVFNHVNLDGNQLLRLVTIEKLSSETASQDDIVNAVNSILSAYKNKLEPYTVIEKAKLDSYYTKSETSSSTEISNALKNVSVDLSEYYKKSETSSAAQIDDRLNASYYTKQQTEDLISSMLSASIEAALTAQYGDVLNEEF